jgi:hypothetical protein
MTFISECHVGSERAKEHENSKTISVSDKYEVDNEREPLGSVAGKGCNKAPL